MPDKKDLHNENEDVRIGVYTCYCGGNISDTVDCEKVRETLEKLPNVEVSRTDMSMCSDAGQAMIAEDIKNNGVNRVVIGACSPSLHEKTFRGAVARAGLNPYLYQHIGIREQDSWVHHGNNLAATEKAIILMNTGISKARLLQPLEPIRLTAQKHALVIGAGVAGLKAALDIARQEIQVTLIEKSPFLGGRMSQLDTIFPTNESAKDSLHELIQKVVNHPLISIHTQSEVKKMSGYIGDFQIQIEKISRGVSSELINKDAAISACPIEVLDEFNYGLKNRKAIYQPYSGSYPSIPAIDWENCTLCGKCAEDNRSGINLTNQSETIEINAGAVVVATGFQPYEPRKGEYGFGEFPEVITLPQMIRLLSLNGKNEDLEFNGRTIKNIGLIHCVGSRHVPGIHEPQEDGKVNDYCSRVCCTATLHLTNDIRQHYPDVNMFDVYEDIRTYGRKHEEYYKQASENLVRFFRFQAAEGPKVVASENGNEQPLVIKTKDYLTAGLDIEIPVDLVVLSVGFIPNPIEELISILKINRGNDRFLQEVHPKLRPIETAVPGIILAGTAQGPMNIQESCTAASAAASKVSVLLGQGQVELEPFIADVDHDKCDGSGECVQVCPYEDAISIETININGVDAQRAVVVPANCVGCGSCVSACPNHAIDVQGWTLGQYDAMVDSIASGMLQLELVA